MPKKSINVESVQKYLRRSMYEQTEKGWKFVPASKGIEGFQNKSVSEIMKPVAEAVLAADYGKRAGVESSVSNRKVINALMEVCQYLGVSEDIEGQKLQLLGCDANAWKRAVTKMTATGMNADISGSGKIIKATMEVIGKRYRRRYYTADGEIK